MRKPSIALLLCSVFASGCWEETGAEKATRQRRERYSHAAAAQEAVDTLVFTRHPASGLCFAHGLGSTGRGGPIFTTVPCEKVEHLLANK